jgi:hypothetical protein
MKLFSKTEDLGHIKEQCAETSGLSGCYEGVSWRLVLGFADKYGANLREHSVGYCRFNSNGPIVGIWASMESLEDYRQKLQQNQEYLLKAIPQAKAEKLRLIEACKKTPGSIVNFPDPITRAIGRLPYPRLADFSCTTSFEFNLQQIHSMIEEAKLKYDAGSLPRVSLWPIWSGVSNFQPALRLEFSK